MIEMIFVFFYREPKQLRIIDENKDNDIISIGKEFHLIQQFAILFNALILLSWKLVLNYLDCLSQTVI